MSVTIKAYLLGKDDVHKEIRRFAVDKEDSTSFNYLSKKVVDVFSNLRNIGFQMYYRGEFQMGHLGNIYICKHAVGHSPANVIKYQIVFINLPCSQYGVCLFILSSLKAIMCLLFIFWSEDPSLPYVVQ